MDYSIEVQKVCDKAIGLLGAENLVFRPMKRQKSVNTKKSYVIGRTSLKTGLVTIDIFTPKKREPKKMASILRVLCHEVAHHQKKPYRELFRGRLIIRQHFPKFYEQVNRNIEILKKDKDLNPYFME
jgi:hypothetical protein